MPPCARTVSNRSTAGVVVDGCPEGEGLREHVGTVGVEQVDARTRCRGRGTSPRAYGRMAVLDQASSTSDMRCSSPAGAHLGVGARGRRAHQLRGRGLRVQQRDRPVAGHRRLSVLRHLVAERRHEGVVGGPAVLAEQVRQDDVGERAAGRHSGSRISAAAALARARRGCPPGLRSSWRRRRAPARLARRRRPACSASSTLPRSTASSDSGPVDPGQVVDRVDAGQRCGQSLRIGELASARAGSARRRARARSRQARCQPRKP